MSATPDNVRALRPISILLASDDESFVERFQRAARELSVQVDHIPLETNAELALARHGSNVYILDAGEALGRAGRLATSFAVLHPSIPVLVLADRAAARTVNSVPLLDKWRSAERLLGEIELLYLGLRR